MSRIFHLTLKHYLILILFEWDISKTFTSFLADFQTNNILNFKACSIIAQKTKLYNFYYFASNQAINSKFIDQISYFD